MTEFGTGSNEWLRSFVDFGAFLEQGKMRNVILAFQWVVFHAGILISGAVVLAGGFGLSPAESGELMRLTFVITGVGSLLQIWIGHQNRIVEGPAVPWWAAYLVLAGIAVPAGTPIEIVRMNIQGAIIVAGAVLAIAGSLGIIRRLRALFSSRVIGVMLTLVSLQVSGVGIRGLIAHGTGLFAIALVVVFAALLLLTRTRGLLKSSALLLTVVSGWGVAIALGIAPLQLGGDFAVLALPRLFPWGAPRFEPGTSFALTVLGLLMIPNQIGSIRAMEYATDTTIPTRLYDRGLAVTGLTNILAGSTGGIGTTPFAISASLVSLTGERSKTPFVLGGALFVFVGIVPVLGQILGTIPVPLASAVLLVSVSTLAVVGIKSMTEEKLNTDGSFVVGISLLTGTGIMFVDSSFWAVVPYWLAGLLSNGVIVGTVTAILLEKAVLRRGRSGGGSQKCRA